MNSNFPRGQEELPLEAVSRCLEWEELKSNVWPLMTATSRTREKQKEEIRRAANKKKHDEETKI